MTRRFKFALFVLLAITPTSLFAQGGVAPRMLTPFKSGGAGAASGSPVTGCTAYSLVFIDSAGNLKCDLTPINGSVTTAGRSIFTVADSITGASATSNFLNITGAFNATLSAETSAVLFSITYDNDAQIQNALKVLGAGTANATSNVVLIDNGASIARPLVVNDNGTPVFTIADGGGAAFASTLSVTGFIAALNDVRLSSTESQTMYFGSTSASGAIGNGTTNTPDGGRIHTGATSNSWQFAEVGDFNFDFNNGACGTAACTDPGLIIHSAVADTTQYNHLSAWGQSGGSIKTLTESAATPVVRIPVAALTGVGGSLRYTIFAADATDTQVREGEIKFAVVNKAAVETCTLSGASELLDGSVLAVSSATTLTYAITCDTTPANAVDISFNAVSSLTQTTLRATYLVTLVGAGQPARQ